MSLPRLILLLATAALVGCDNPSGSSMSTCTPSATKICLSEAAYSPTLLTIAAGATVTWRDGSGIAHTVTSDPGSADAFDLSVGPRSVVSHQFNTQGRFTYHCQFHGAPGTGMHGTVVVN